MDMNGNQIFAVDFDGTLSLGARWPECGEPNRLLFGFLKEQKEHGARVILWTCRAGNHLKAAVEYCEKQGLVFDTINENLPELIEAYGNDCRKVNADYYIDDKAIRLFLGREEYPIQFNMDLFWGKIREEIGIGSEEGEK